MESRAGEGREKDGSTLSSTTWNTCGLTWWLWTRRIELSGDREPVWLTPHLRDPQPEGERESGERKGEKHANLILYCSLITKSAQF